MPIPCFLHGKYIPIAQAVAEKQASCSAPYGFITENASQITLRLSVLCLVFFSQAIPA